MPKKDVPTVHQTSLNAQPRIHQSAREIQPYGTVSHALPLELEEPVRLEMTEQLNLLLADTMTLRDLYKKSHWQVAGPTFYQLHLLFDKHYDEQVEIVDEIAERIQLLGGVSLAMAADIAETTRIPRPPKGREEVPVPGLSPSGCSQDHHRSLSSARASGFGTGRRWHQRYGRQRRLAAQRATDLVPE
jgi:starvation-inducible DNA-binding protein